MANFGPAGWAATLDGLSADQETIQAAEGLPRITRFGGITPEGLFVDLTALGDAFENEGPIGVRRIPRFLMEGFADDDADSAYQRIGEPAAIIAYPAAHPDRHSPDRVHPATGGPRREKRPPHGARPPHDVPGGVHERGARDRRLRDRQVAAMTEKEPGAAGFVVGFLILVAVCVAIAWWITS